MASYNKSFNFRNGVQVDNNKFIVNENGLVGIGTSVPVGAILDVYGDVKVSGFLTATSLRAKTTSIDNVVCNSVNSTGIITSNNGFTSGIGVTNPVQITVSGNILTFNIVGVGSTSLTLY